MNEVERVKVDELVGVKIHNCFLKITLAEIEVRKLIRERDELAKGEAIRLGINLDEYAFDMNTYEFVNVKKETKGGQ